MKLDEIEIALQKESGLKMCVICGMPFRPYHSRQKTCGSAECKRAHHINCVIARTERIKRERPNEYKAFRRECSRRARAKKKALKARETQLKALAERWEKQKEFDDKISKYGIEYGKRSAEKVLSTVQKIDVEAFIKEIENGKKLCNKD